MPVVHTLLINPGFALRTAAVAVSCLASSAFGEPLRTEAWAAKLHGDLAQLESRQRLGIGVYVRDLDTGVAMSYRAEETWYLASTVKVPVAIAVLRGVERGDYTLDTVLTLRAADYVDGAGQTNHHAVGSPLSLRYLLEQMIVYSDNTASDMLIGLVGIRDVNAVAQSLSPGGFERITSLADVRRAVYAHLVPAATHLSGKEFLALNEPRADADRLKVLARLMRTPTREFLLDTLGQAYDAYYASGLNSGRLDAYADLLAQLSDGKALNAANTRYLLGVMERIKTGPQRVRAGLPVFTRFAHKTGTQRARTCDSGVITVPRLGGTQRVVIAACTRGELSLARSDLALRQVGTALCRSGLLTGGKTDDIACDPVPSLVPLLGTAER